MVRLRDADWEIHPNLCRHVSEDLPDVAGDARLRDLLCVHGGMDEPTARDTVSGGIRSPLLVLAALDGADGGFRPEHPGEIVLAAEIARRFEDAFTSPEATRLVQATLLAAIVAWWRARSGDAAWQGRAAAFLQAAYGGAPGRWWQRRSDGVAQLNDILFQYRPTGAGPDTVRADRLPAGVAGSEAMAAADAPSIRPLKDRFDAAGRKFQLPPALLAAIASRESRAGRVLRADGTGDGGHAYGIMQIDIRNHTALRGRDPASQEHVEQAAGILYDNLRHTSRRFAASSQARQLQAAVAAYNFGVGNARTLGELDRGSTNDDYSNDVWARACYFARQWI